MKLEERDGRRGKEGRKKEGSTCTVRALIVKASVEASRQISLSLSLSCISIYPSIYTQQRSGE